MALRYGKDLWIYRRLLLQARPYWPHIGALFLLTLLATPLSLLNPLPLKIGVDSALGSKPLPGFLAAVVPLSLAGSASGKLIVAVVLIVATTVLSQLRGFVTGLLDTYTGEKLVLAFRTELFQQVQRLSLAYHDRKGSTDALYRIVYDAPAIRWITVQGVIPFVNSILTVVLMTYVAARIDWELALVAMLVAPLLFGMTQMFRQRIRDEWSKVKEGESSSMNGVQEAISLLRVVRAFGQEGRENERFRRGLERNVRGQLRLALINGGFDSMIGLTTAISTATALYIGVRHIQAGQLTLGNLLIVMAYLSQLYSPLTAISRKIADLQAALASAERTFALLDQEPDVSERPDARSLGRATGAVALRDVCFAYPNGPQVLHNISFEIAPGNRVGIMGTTGAGKTTLVNLLMRLYDPSAGSVLLDGVDIREFRVADLRNQFSIVLQDPVLFSSSIAENIAYARPWASPDEIMTAARHANAHDFISRLPHGYETRVGERGMSLSGGERQRIALARAFLKDAPILILDEPTSSVDVQTESAIIDAMELLMKGRTTFIIAHRQSTLRKCSVQLCLEKGRLVAGGADALALSRAGVSSIAGLRVANGTSRLPQAGV
jgi:ATP-binding cassette, subfamily B, bacterial